MQGLERLIIQLWLFCNCFVFCILSQMPLLETHLLRTHHELRLAHLALSIMTMGYVWQEGERETVKVQQCFYMHSKPLTGLKHRTELSDYLCLSWTSRRFHGVCRRHSVRCLRDWVCPRFSPTLTQSLPTGRKEIQMGKLTDPYNIVFWYLVILSCPVFPKK